jgi:BirA family transcriptional regulator, biotin operon repressor / biotin---[acetyl-CoA-carboxylase] ligase
MAGTEQRIASADDVLLAATPARLVHVVETASTNTLALDRALAGAPLPLWVLADRQTAGRGRAGRSWQAAEGNLFASLAISPAGPPQRAGELSLVAGVAVVDAVRALVPGEARLKWPNDIILGRSGAGRDATFVGRSGAGPDALLSGRSGASPDALLSGRSGASPDATAGKVGGILIESTSLGPMRIAVIGIGLNLAAAPADVPGAAVLPGAVAPRAMLAALARSLGRWLDCWDAGAGFAAVREAWLAAAGPLGTPITVNTGSKRLAGTYAGLDTDGALLLRTLDGTINRITFGDVIVAPLNEDQLHEPAR